MTPTRIPCIVALAALMVFVPGCFEGNGSGGNQTITPTASPTATPTPTPGSFILDAPLEGFTVQPLQECAQRTCPVEALAQTPENLEAYETYKENGWLWVATVVGWDGGDFGAGLAVDSLLKDYSLRYILNNRTHPQFLLAFDTDGNGWQVTPGLNIGKVLPAPNYVWFEAGNRSFGGIIAWNRATNQLEIPDIPVEGAALRGYGYESDWVILETTDVNNTFDTRWNGHYWAWNPETNEVRHLWSTAEGGYANFRTSSQNHAAFLYSDETGRRVRGWNLTTGEVISDVALDPLGYSPGHYYPFTVGSELASGPLSFFLGSRIGAQYKDSIIYDSRDGTVSLLDDWFEGLEDIPPAVTSVAWPWGLGSTNTDDGLVPVLYNFEAREARVLDEETSCPPGGCGYNWLIDNNHILLTGDSPSNMTYEYQKSYPSSLYIIDLADAWNNATPLKQYET